MSKVLIYGLSSYTDAWVKVKRAYKGFDLLPAKSLATLTQDLVKYPKLKVLVLACWTEIILSQVDGLHINETLSPLVTDVYQTVLSVLQDSAFRVIFILLLTFSAC